MRLRIAVSLLVLSATTLCAQSPSTRAPASSQPSSTAIRNRVVEVARGLEHPWAIAFLPDGRMLVTERPGRLRIIARDGSLSAPLAGLPSNIYSRGQGGLLDVVLDPKFSENRTIYFSFSEMGDGGAGTAVARAELGANRLDNVRVIYRQQPKTGGGAHFGSRLVFRRDGTLFVTQGDRFSQRDKAQDLDSLIGKVVRIKTDGSVPRDNPFVGRSDARPEIWSYGHRNVQSAALHPDTGVLWTVEHGARGGDELNHAEAGKNYGWPVITYGRDYSGASIGRGTAQEGMEQPVYYWDPVIAPSGMAIYTGDKYPGWKGSFFIGSLTPGAIVRLVVQNGRVTKEERYLGNLNERIREVRQGPDGLLYVATDSDDGRVLRLEP